MNKSNNFFNSSFFVFSPLYIAIYSENDHLTRELLRHTEVDILVGEIGKRSKDNELSRESCLYIAILKRSHHVILMLLRRDADELERHNLDELRKFASQEGIDLDHFISVAHYSRENLRSLVKNQSDETIILDTNIPSSPAKRLFFDLEIKTFDHPYETFE